MRKKLILFILIVLCVGGANVRHAHAREDLKTFVIPSSWREAKIEKFQTRHAHARIIYIIRAKRTTRQGDGVTADGSYINVGKGKKGQAVKIVCILRVGSHYYDDFTRVIYPDCYSKKQILIDLGYYDYKLIK